MRISIAADHAGFELKNEMIDLFSFYDVGTCSVDQCDYPIFAKLVVDDVLNSKSNFGILICGSGIGMSIAANKYLGIRAALCYNELSAKLAREHNDANIICLGSKFVGKDQAVNIIKTFLNTNFSSEQRHQKRIDIINKLGERI